MNLWCGFGEWRAEESVVNGEKESMLNFKSNYTNYKGVLFIQTMRDHISCIHFEIDFIVSIQNSDSSELKTSVALVL